MNAELRDLLVEGGCATAGRAGFAWSQVVMIHNVARIPSLRPAEGDSVWARGFNLLVLDACGTPRHYVKCRPATEGSVGRETAVLSALAARPALRRVIPSTGGAASKRVQVQVTPYLPGRSLESLAASLGHGEWERAILQVLSAAALVAAEGRAACGGLFPVAERLSLLEEGRWAVEHLGRMGLPASDVLTLQSALAAGGIVPAELQHGDLWPANVVRHDGAWWLLDFEVFGEIQVPLFDAFHLVRSAPGLAASGTPWLEAMDGEGPWVRASRRLIRSAAERHALGPEAVAGALTFYLARMAADLHRRGNPRAFWGGLLGETALLAHRLRIGGGRLPELTGPSARSARA